MKRLSKKDLEAIGNRVFAAYQKLPEVKGHEIYSVNPELLVQELLRLNLDYKHLSLDGETLGLTTFGELGVTVYGLDDSEELYYLDGKTVLVEQDLKNDLRMTGRRNFSVMHEGGHHILKMMFPNDYGVCNAQPEQIHFYKLDSSMRKPITDWEEWQTNVLTSYILMPKELVEKAMFMCGIGEKIHMINKIYAPIQYQQFSILADMLGVSKQALSIRLRELKKVDYDYYQNPYEFMWG